MKATTTPELPDIGQRQKDFALKLADFVAKEAKTLTPVEIYGVLTYYQMVLFTAREANHKEAVEKFGAAANIIAEVEHGNKALPSSAS